MRRHPRLLNEVLAALAAGGHNVTPRPTSGPRDATEIVRQCLAEGANLILAAGGDGTINEVINGMVGSDVPFGVMPFGTANVFAMEVGFGGNPLHTAARLSECEPVRIGVGRLCGLDGSLRRHFLLMAGVGLDAHIVANLNNRIKNMLGKGAYWLAGFQSLARRLDELEVEYEGRRVRCGFALSSRVRNYGGDLEIALGASLLRDHIEVMLFEGSNPFRYLKYFLGVALRNTARMKGVTTVQSHTLTLHPVNGNKVHIQLDGEDAGYLPAKIEFLPDALTLLLPPDYLTRERRRWKI